MELMMIFLEIQVKKNENLICVTRITCLVGNIGSNPATRAEISRLFIWAVFW